MSHKIKIELEMIFDEYRFGFGSICDIESEMFKDFAAVADKYHKYAIATCDGPETAAFVNLRSKIDEHKDPSASPYRHTEVWPF